MIDGNIDVLSLEGMLVSSVSLEGDLLPIGPKGDKGDPGFSPVVTTSKSGKTTTVKFETATGNVYAYIQDGEDGQGSGDMLTDVYDKNKNGIVDDAEKVNGKTVLSNVPANAVFTDTVYDDTEVRGLINAKPDFSDIPINVSELTNDAHYVSSDGASTVSGENTDFSLTGTTEGMFKELDLKGNTSQKTLSGKNLCNGINQNAWLNTPSNSAGMAPDNSGLYIPVNSGNYTISTTTSQARYRVACFDNLPLTSRGQTAYNGVNKDGTSDTITIDTTGHNYLIVNATDLTKIQIEKGSTATSYEQYCGGVPSPNPDYPQDVNVVSGDNSIEICSKNLFDNNNANALNNIYIDENERIVKAANNVKSIYMKIVGGETYTISKRASARFRVATTKVLPADNVSVYNYVKNENGTNITITANNDSQYMVIFLYNSIVDTLTFEQILDSVQIEKGSTSTTYEAYTGATYNIDLPVENLIDDSLKASAVNNVYIGTGSTSLEMPFKAGTYTISTNVSAYLQYLDTTTHSSSTETTQWTFTLENDTNIRIRIQKIGLVASDVEWVQVEKGTKANTYTPYGTTPIELNKIGTYQDYFYKDNDKWYLHKETGKVVLNGSESWSINGNVLYTSISNKKTLKTMMYVNYYKYNVNDWGNLNNYEITDGNGNNVIFIKDTNYSTVGDFKTWLSTHNINVYYILATPTNTEITDTTLKSQLNALYKAYTYKNKTNISQSNNDLPFILNVEAFTDTYNGRYENIINMIKKAQ